MSTSLPVDLTAERRNRGLSKAAMARQCGIGYATWCAAEKGERVSEATQKSIADEIGLTVVEAFPEESEAAA
jgi:hypothetical protein